MKFLFYWKKSLILLLIMIVASSCNVAQTIDLGEALNQESTSSIGSDLTVAEVQATAQAVASATAEAAASATAEAAVSATAEAAASATAGAAASATAEGVASATAEAAGSATAEAVASATAEAAASATAEAVASATAESVASATAEAVASATAVAAASATAEAAVSATAEAQASATAEAAASATAEAMASATANAQASATAEAAASATAEAAASATAEAEASATAEAAASATAEAAASATAEAAASATAEAQASATAEAQASATAYAEASATANAQASATAEAAASATAEAAASATAEAQASATADAQASATADAQATVAAQDYPETKVVASDAAADDWFGWSVSISGNNAIVGSYQDDDGASKAGSAYIYIYDHSTNTWDQTAKLNAPVPAAQDYFGYSVSISGNTAVVGSQADDDTFVNSGSAYIFQYDPSSNTWDQTAKLNASDPAATDNFGRAVSISGNTAIIAAPLDDDAGGLSGSAYIFQYDPSSDTWDQTTKLTASDAAGGDWFGNSVSISENTAIVGGPYNDNGGADSGSAYLFQYDLSTNTWDQKIKFTASDAAAGDNFGIAVSVSQNTAIVGSPYNDDDGGDSGSAYIFQYDPSLNTWAQKAKLTASDAAAGDNFGFSVSVSGNTAVVGAYNDDDGGGNAGSTYIFQYDPTSDTWSETKKLTASDGAGSDAFGYAVSNSGNTTIVGGYLDDDDGPASGSAYIYELNIDNIAPAPLWEEEKISQGGAGEYFGIALSISGNTAISGAASPTSTAGKVKFFHYEPSANTWDYKLTVTASDSAAGNYFGESVSLSGNNMIAGSRLNDDNGADSGSAYIFQYEPTYIINMYRWTEKVKLIASDAAAGDEFGKSVAISGNTAIVGSHYDDDGGSKSGSAYIFQYDPSSNTWIQKTKLTASDAQASDYFGNSVAISGNIAVIGAHYSDDIGASAGSAYIFQYDPSTNTWEQKAKLTAFDAAAGDNFGGSVAVSENTVVVGAIGDDDAYSSLAGSAYIFHHDPSTNTWDFKQKVISLNVSQGSIRFGGSVSVSGSNIVVGTLTENKAYFYQYNPYTHLWEEKDVLTSSDLDPFDYFGRAVSISGNTIMSGAYADDDNGAESGSAYIYRLDFAP